MTEKELQAYIFENYAQENEKCEWKEFKSLKHSVAGRKGEDIATYISAIANMNGGHLIIGVQDKTLNIVGIQDFSEYNIDNIKFRILGNCTNLDSENFNVQEHITLDTKKTIWVFHIPKHSFRLPVYAHKKAWQRINDNLVEITPSRLNSIITEIKIEEDWTSVIIQEASLNDLDNAAIQKARFEFNKRNPKYSDEIDKWDNVKFLDKAKLTIKGKITRTALILLGKDEAEHLLGSFVKIRWNLKTITNEDKDFEIFSIPLIITVDEVYAKIRNLKYRYLKDGTLFPDEVLRYDPFNIREPLNNAIAHQDYTKGGRINVVEFEDDHLVFSNYGSFLPKSVEDVVLKDTPEEKYRNRYLVEAMKNLDMIETQGGGIRKIFNNQRLRFFPMPDFDLSDGKVKVTITGKILDEDFARILVKNPTLSLGDMMLLDKVQKKKNISDEEYRYLKRLRFIEGKKSNCYLSFKVVQPTGDDDLKIQYLRNKSFDDDHFRRMIIDYLAKYSSASRKALNTLIIPKLSEALTEIQKSKKVENLLLSLRRLGKIRRNNTGEWELIHH